MKKPKGIALFVFVALIALSCVPSISAVSTQWFPGEGTTTEYRAGHMFNLLNGTNLVTYTFNLYDSGSEYSAVPTINDLFFTPPDISAWTLIANNTEIFYRFSYTEDVVVTQWKRTKSFTWTSGNITSNEDLHVYATFDVSLPSYLPIDGDPDYVQKSNFFTTHALGSFLDYFDSSLGIDDLIQPYSFKVIAVTPDVIVAHLHQGNRNFTYIGDTSGRVLSYISTGYYPIHTTKGIANHALIFDLVGTDAGIPAFPLLLTLLSLTLGVLIIRIGSRRKVGL